MLFMENILCTKFDSINDMIKSLNDNYSYEIYNNVSEFEINRVLSNNKHLLEKDENYKLSFINREIIIDIATDIQIKYGY